MKYRVAKRIAWHAGGRVKAPTGEKGGPVAIERDGSGESASGRPV
jgi:hypothetical protein